MAVPNHEGEITALRWGHNTPSDCKKHICTCSRHLSMRYMWKLNFSRYCFRHKL